MQEAQRSDAKKKLEIKHFLSKGVFIDAKDTFSNWCVAYIIEVMPDSEMLKVRFDGWSNKWNEYYKYSSTRIAPFRKYSSGYTGHCKIAMRDWTFSQEELEQFKEKIESTIKCDFSDLSVFSLTQFFRGTYYIFIDELLSSVSDVKSKETLDSIFGALKLHLKLSVHFLKKLPTLFSDVILSLEKIIKFQKALNNPEAFLIEENAALSHCAFEIIETLCKIFGSGERTQKLYRENTSLILTMTNNLQSEKKWINENLSAKTEGDSWLRSQQSEKTFKSVVSSMINHFCGIGGYSEVLSLLNIDENKPLIPIKCLEPLFKLIRTLLEYLKDQYKEELVKTLKSAIEKRFKLLNEKEIKDFDKDLVSNFLNEAKALFQQYLPEEDVYKFIEKLELDLALKCLKSPFFEKRLKGVNEIKEISEKIDYTESNQSYQYDSYSHVSRRKFLRYLNSKIFLEWISDNQIVEILLGDSMHVEIIKRCHDILIFMGKHKYMPKEILTQIWKAGEGKHDSLVRGIYDMIIEISAYLPIESLQFLYEKIKEIPLSSFLELTLNLVKGFTDSVIKTHAIKMKLRNNEILSSDEKTIEEQFLGVELLWKAILDSSPLNIALIEMAIGHIKSITSLPNAGILRNYFMGKCMSEIKNSSSIPQSLMVAYNIIQYYAGSRDFDNSFKKIQNLLRNQSDIVALIISDLKRYKDLVRSALKPSKSLNYLDHAFEGKFSHKVNLERRLKMIEIMVSAFGDYRDPVLSLEQLQDLWLIFITQANHESDRRLYCSWLMKKSDDENPGEIIIFLPTKGHIFHQMKIFCNKTNTDFCNLIEEEFECFTYLFKVVNFYEAKIKLLKTGKFSIIDFDLTGKSDLWDIFLNTSSQKITESSIALLIDLHLQFAATFDKNKKRTVQDDFTIKCINLLKQSFNNQNFALLNKAISLIIAFFDKFEGKPIISSSTSSTSQRQSVSHQISVTVLLRPEEIKKEIKVSLTENLGTFKRKISEEFKLPLRQFTFANKGSSDFNDPNEDETLLRELGWPHVYTISRKSKRSEEGTDENYHPKKLISDNPEYLDLLFMLLSNPNSGCLNIIWDLLMKLPVNEKIKETLFKLEKKWEELFDENSLYKSLYCLQIIEDFMLNANGLLDRSDGKAWKKKMQQSGALNFFLEVYAKQSFENYTNVIAKKYVASLLKVINRFASM